MTARQRGDFAVVSAGGELGRLVRYAEQANGSGPYADYQHAFIYIGDGEIIQAEPGGADYAQLTPHAKTLWSTGKIAIGLPGTIGRLELSAEQRTRICDAARGYVGTKYSFLDYLALAMHRLHIRVPFLKWYVKWSGRMICSQLVDRCYLDAGIHLFDDGRWPGYVTPADLAQLLDTP